MDFNFSSGSQPTQYSKTPYKVRYISAVISAVIMTNLLVFQMFNEQKLGVMIYYPQFIL